MICCRIKVDIHVNLTLVITKLVACWFIILRVLVYDLFLVLKISLETWNLENLISGILCVKLSTELCHEQMQSSRLASWIGFWFSQLLYLV